jgi:hypothetical protein
MDIHAPHQPVHSWRDFFTHIAIITIGLFLALMLEAGVDWLHHRHLVHQARENIRHELEDNHKGAQKDLALLDKNIQLQKNNIAAIHGLMTNGEKFRGSVANSFAFDSPDTSAWRTARDSGALGYMPYEEVQRYSDIYSTGEFVQTHAIETAEHDFLAGAPFKMGYDAGKLPPDAYTQLLRDNAAVEIQLETLRQIVQQFDDACVAELKK